MHQRLYGKDGSKLKFDGKRDACGGSHQLIKEFNMKLTNKQAEQLMILAEECAEVQKEAMKILRFGLSIDNLDHLTKELGDILGIMQWVVVEHDIDPEYLVDLGKAKQEKMLKWTSYQGNCKQSEELL